MKSFSFFVLFLLLSAGASAQTVAKNVQKAADGTNAITESLSFGSGKTGSFLADSTLSIAGTLSGTPTGGTLNLSALTLTMPASLSIGGITFSGNAATALNSITGTTTLTLGGTRLIHTSTAGTDSLFIGTSATGGAASTSIAIGYNALAGALNTTSDNIAIGYNALAAGSSATNGGGQQIAIGNSALAAATTGSYHNNAVGDRTLVLLTTGNGNNAFGQHNLSALLGNSSGNTALGDAAMELNQYADYNTVVGSYAMNAGVGTSGDHITGNAAFGQQSLRYTTGDSNSAFGTSSLGANTTGTQNVALGSAAGNTNTTGSQLTFVGTNADTNAATGYTNSTALGYGALVTGSNRIRLGNASVTLVDTYGSLQAGGSLISDTSTITGGAASMTITAGTGNSRTLALKSTTSGGTATTFLTGNADQSVTLANHLTMAGTLTGATTISGSAALNAAASSHFTLTTDSGYSFVLSGTAAANTALLQFPASDGTLKKGLSLGTIPVFQLNSTTLQANSATTGMFLRLDTTGASAGTGVQFSSNGTLKWDLGHAAGTGSGSAFELYNRATSVNALTVASADNALSLAGPLVGAVQSLSGAGAVNITQLTTAYTSTGGAQALTLANGVAGQIKVIVHDVDGGSGVLTPTTKTGFSTITFTNAGDTVTLQYFATRGWMVISSYGVTIAP